MKNLIMGLLAIASLSVPALADNSKITKGYNTMDAMGCMLLRECTDGVKQIHSLLDISSQYDNTDKYTPFTLEFNRMLLALDAIGVKVFLADQKYFPIGHRGVYHTVSNNFFLNKDHMGEPDVLMTVMRHEGWHAAQDCMAGSINNSMIAIIHPEEDVPMLWRTLVERTYPESVVPWEAEAQWAGRTEHMTMRALEVCAEGEMWKHYKPTPLTEKWLREEGFIN